MDERIVEGHRLLLHVAALEAWEAMGIFVVLGALLGAVAIVVASATRFARDESLPALGLLPILTAACAAGAAWLAAREPVDGVLFLLAPDLASRYRVAEALAFLPGFVGLAALVAMLADVPAWLGPHPRRQAARLAVSGAVVAGGALVFALASSVRAERRELAAMNDLPCVRSGRPLELHVGQELRVALGADDRVELTTLGVRARPNILFFIAGGNFVEPAAGGRDDRLALDAHERFRVPFDPAERQGWGASELVVRAPSEPGRFAVPVVFERGLVRVETELSAVAIDDTGDPLLPLAEGRTLTYLRVRRERREERSLPGVVLRVVDTQVVDGFRTLTVEVEDPLAEPPVRRAIVVPREGRYALIGPNDGSPRLDGLVESVSLAPSSTGGPPSREGLVDGEQPCLVTFLDGVCACGADGPSRCLGSDSHLGDTLAWAGINLLTLGTATLFGGMRPPDTTYVESRLVEVDGRPIAAGPAFVRPPEPVVPRRRR